MNMTRHRSLSVLSVFAAIAAISLSSLFAQDVRKPEAQGGAAEFPVVKVALFSSGVGYFEHAGRVSGDVSLKIPFRSEEVNDALKSLVVYPGAGGASPSVSYPSKTDFARALRAFSVDLSGAPAVAELLARMRGAELEAKTGLSVKAVGKILSVEQRPSSDGKGSRVYVSLLGDGGVRSVALDEIDSFRFTDPVMDADFSRALTLIAQSRDATRTALELSLPGRGEREAFFGYVVAAPVWKASYRLDLSAKPPYLQGWAIVDNATDRDWKNVSLSLISGRPVSFIQDLYAPVYVDRPLLPPSIAGAAAPQTYAGGIGGAAADEDSASYEVAPSRSAKKAELAAPAPAASAARDQYRLMSEPKAKTSAAGAAALSSSAFETSQARAAGDQFEFTVARPVSLDRGRSALLPLVAGDFQASRVSVYTAGRGRAMLGAKLENSSGMKLPAGPITVFDDGVYAGDALLDFLSEKDSRLIAFGEDLGLTIEESASTSLETVGVSVSKGVMTFSKRRSVSKSYAFKNASAREKRIILEHPETSGAELFTPSQYLEKADGRYRFAFDLNAGKQQTFVVVERAPTRETVVLASLGVDSFLRYSSSKEIPDQIRQALSSAADLRRKWDSAAKTVRELQARKSELNSDQGRIRSNLDSIGRDSAEGKRYLKRLLDAEAEMDKLTDRIETSRKAAQDAQADYEKFLESLSL